MRVWVAALLLGACGTASRASPAPPPEIATARARPPLAPHAVWLPEVTPIRRVAEHDGAELWVAGSLRVAIDPSGAATVSSDYFASYIRDAARLSGGWLFRADDGVVAQAETFTGPLTRIGHVEAPIGERGAPPRAVATGEGRWVGRHTDRRGWTSTGGALEPLELEDAVSIAFVDRDHGAAVLDGGFLVRTADGGASWAAVRLDEPVVEDLVFEEGKVWIPLPGGTLALGPDGTLAPASRPAPRRYEEAELRPVLHAIYATFPELADPESETPDGFAIWWTEDGEEHGVPTLLVRPGEARVIGPAPMRGRAWGPSAFVGGVTYYRGGRSYPETHRWRIGESPARLEWDAAIGQSGVCPDERGQVLAWVNRGQAVFGSDLEAPDRIEAPGWAVRSVAPLTDELAFALAVSVSSDSPRELPPPGQPLPDFVEIAPVPLLLNRATGDWRRVCTAPEGASVALGYRVRGRVIALEALEGERRWAGAGDADRCVELHPVPAEAGSACFVSRTQAFAVGGDASQVWATSDGGARWAPISLDVDGDASTLLVGQVARGRRGCNAITELALRWSGTDEEAPRRRVFAPEPLMLSPGVSSRRVRSAPPVCLCTPASRGPRATRHASSTAPRSMAPAAWGRAPRASRR